MSRYIPGQHRPTLEDPVPIIDITDAALAKPQWHHRYSPLGDSREHAVPCRFCRATTWNICGYCNQDCPCGEVD